MTNSEAKATKINVGNITLGDLKEAMKMYAMATDADALRRVTESVIEKMEAVKFAEGL